MLRSTLLFAAVISIATFSAYIFFPPVAHLFFFSFSLHFMDIRGCKWSYLCEALGISFYSFSRLDFFCRWKDTVVT